MDITDLELNLLEFRQKSFQFARLATIEGTEFAVFSRTETESERQFRPRLVHLHLAVPRAWIRLDPAGEMLQLVPDGHSAAAPSTRDAEEVGAERSEFTEAGEGWRREAGAGGFHLYVPTRYAATLLTPEGHRALGFP
ncbi:MAG: hypothetical protein AAFA34_02015 [Thermoplasmata archaeon]|jgi:hypothetical protein